MRSLPSWDALAGAFSGIFERRYFANNGPLVRQLDEMLTHRWDGVHAVAVANEMAAMLVAIAACEMHGEVIVPAYASRLLLESLAWCDLKPVLCEVSAQTFTLAPETVAAAVTERTGGIVAAHFWSAPAHETALVDMARERNIRVVYDAQHLLGKLSEPRDCVLGDAAYLSIGEETIINAADCAVALTRDDELAKRMRTIRNFHPGETFAPVPLRLNAKMSEAQAALALLSLEDLPSRIARCEDAYCLISDRVNGMPGVSVLPAHGNAARVFALVDPEHATASADSVQQRLHAAGIESFRPLRDRTFARAAFPAAAYVCDNLLELTLRPS